MVGKHVLDLPWIGRAKVVLGADVDLAAGLHVGSKAREHIFDLAIVRAAHPKGRNVHERVVVRQVLGQDRTDLGHRLGTAQLRDRIVDHVLELPSIRRLVGQGSSDEHQVEEVRRQRCLGPGLGY
jgi:hypothetical protein